MIAPRYLVVAVALMPSMLPAALSPAEPEGETLILATGSFWRCYYVLRPPVVRKEGAVEKVTFDQGKWLNFDTPLPPAGWRRPEFDDGGWPRVAGAFQRLRRRGVGGKSPLVALACRRGKFTVTDPARAGEMKLSIRYHGGVVVYLNGAEVARGHLPTGDPVTPETLADDYPLEAQVKVDGSPLVLTQYYPDKANLERMTLRVRTLADVVLPARLLRKGTNVLAVELHRAPYRPEAVSKEARKSVAIGWGTCGLVSVRLRASTPAGVTGNVARPRGLQVWNSDPLASDLDLDYGDRTDRPRPIRLVGARGGAFSGKVVVGSTEAIRGLRAGTGDLRRVGGPGRIAASAVQVRYALPWGTEKGLPGRYPLPVSRFDALAEAAPDEVPVRIKTPPRRGRRPSPPPKPAPVFGAVQPVWVTVRVPADAEPGDYEGTLTVRAGGRQVAQVPLRLKVCGWTLPRPREFRTFVEFIQSPDTLALEYKVPLWSAEHFRLIGKSLELLGEVGCRTAYVPLICKTNLGNAESMVRWVRKPDGGYVGDFSVMERYLDLVAKHLGKPEVVCLVVWDTFLEGGRYTGLERYMPEDVRADRGAHGRRGPEVTVLSPATGQTETVALPRYRDPAGKPLWRPVLVELRRRLKRRGLEKAAMLGFTTDTTPVKDTVMLMKELMGDVPWLSQSHSHRRSLHGVPCGYTAHVWGTRFARDPTDERGHGWKRQELVMSFPRGCLEGFPLPTVRLLAELNIAGDMRGFARQGGDFWPVLKDSDGRRVGRVSTGRFPKSSWRALNIVSAFLAPGPRGPVSTVRLEMVREGVQECEARIFIERALTDPDLRKGLGDGLAGRCQAILDRRTRDLLRGMSALSLGSHFTSNAESPYMWWSRMGTLGSYWYIASGWQQRSEELFSAAAEVERALNAK